MKIGNEHAEVFVCNKYNPSTGDCAFHFHPYYEIDLIYAGERIYQNGANKILLTEKMLITHAPYTFHAAFTVNHNACGMYMIFFRPEDCENNGANGSITIKDTMFANAHSIVTTLTDAEYGTVGCLLDNIIAYDDNIPLKHTLLSCIIGLLNEYFRADNGKATVYTSTLTYICSVLQFITANIGERLTINGLCEHFNVSRNKLSRDFISYTGQSLHKYILSERIEVAKRLLKTKNILETALECGFYDESHFIMAFKKHTGRTPGIYMREHGGDTTAFI